MERIYKPRQTIETNVSEFLLESKLNILPDKYCTKIPKTDEEIKFAMNFNGTDDDYQDLLSSVSIDQHLFQFDDVRTFNSNSKNVLKHRRSTVEFHINALKLQRVKDLIEKMKNTKALDRIKKFSNKYKNIQMKVHGDDELPNLKIHEDAILTIRFYDPFVHVPDERNRNNPKFRQEFNVLSTNYLSELRDKIQCQCNYGPFKDISENPFNNDDNDTTTTDYIDSNFLFIHDTFYIDTRNPNNLDYSDNIMKFTKTREEFGELKKAIMQETQFKDLQLKIGYPYVYQHFGNCEHVFTFSDIHMINESNSLYITDYPLLTRLAFRRYKFCSICGTNAASFIVKNSLAHIHNPVFLCNSCFKSYHYVDNKKIGKFEAYRYYGNELIQKTKKNY